jgi:hypothetical protein
MATVRLFVYTGRNRSEIPQNVTQIKVDSGIKRIPNWMLYNLESLVEVSLPKRLEAIGDHAFFRCSSLEKINFPSSLTEIGNNAFEDCSSLNPVQLQEGLKSIGVAAFRSCMSLRSIIIPASVTHIAACAFAGCSSLVSIYLPDSLNFINNWFLRCESLKMVRLPATIHSIAPHAFFCCRSLMSLEVPEGVSSIWGGSFTECPLLRNVFIPPVVVLLEASFDGCTQLQQLFPDEDDRINALKTRFDGLPIHEICYYQAYHNTATSLEKFKSAIVNDDTARERQDSLGMTPLHILALSVKPNFHLWKELLGNSPMDIEVEDKWGSLPIDYLVYNNPSGSLSLLSSTIKAMTTKRLKSLGLARWKIEVLKLIEELSDDTDRSDQVELIFSELAKYVMLEALSLLEQALWKAKIDDLKSVQHCEERTQKKVKICDAASIGVYCVGPVDRKTCRINCGAEIVIPNVLRFLGKTRRKKGLVLGSINRS